MSISRPTCITVMLHGQMNRGGYLIIDENGAVKIAEELPNNRNPFTFHEERITGNDGKQLKRFHCINYPTKYLTGNEDNYAVHGEPTVLAGGNLSSDSLWEVKSYHEITDEMQSGPTNWVALLHVQSQRYFVIKPKAGNYTDGLPPLQFCLGSKDDAVNQAQGAFFIREIQ